MKKIPLTKGMFALVDDKEYESLSKVKWLYDDGYAKRHNPERRGQWILMHRKILNVPKGLFTDHINGNKLDNRKENLRICNISQNSMNRTKQSNNTSGFKGVSWDKTKKRWRSTIKLNKKQIHLGFYKEITDAANAYNDGAKIYFKEFAK